MNKYNPISWLILIITIIMLSGCKDYCGSCRDTYNFDYNDIETGLRVKDYTESGEILDINKFIMAWNNVQACTGLSALPGPYIAIIESYKISPYLGMYYKEDNVIEISSSAVYIDKSVYTIFNRVISHEYVHYLLDFNGIVDISHKSKLFKQCEKSTNR